MERIRTHSICLRRATAVLILTILTWASFAINTSAASWNGIEPFKSRRDEVVKALGKPIGESSEGALRFAVSGGSVLVSFVSEKFVTNKKLRPGLAGTVLEIVLQHEHASDTPESMSLLTNKEFVRDEVQNASIFRSNKSGIVYTFVDGKLKTTRFTFSEAQLARMRR
jgi:hypothetical protein